MLGAVRVRHVTAVKMEAANMGVDRLKRTADLKGLRAGFAGLARGRGITAERIRSYRRSRRGLCNQRDRHQQR